MRSDERIFEALLATANGRLTAAERHEQRQFALSREQPQAAYS